MLNFLKHKWLKYKIDNARLLKDDNKDCDIFFITSFVKKHPEYSDDETENLIEEYKDFMFLAATSTEECTPSKGVDDIWHHHILHTKDYFDYWCKDIIGKVIHHNPETPTKEKNFTEQFDATNKKLAALKPAYVAPIKKKRRKTVTASQTLSQPYSTGISDTLSDALLLHSMMDNSSSLCEESSSHNDSSNSSSCSSSSSSSSCSSSSSSCSSSSCGGGGGD